MVCGLSGCGKAEKGSCRSFRRTRREVTGVCVTDVSCLGRGHVAPWEKTTQPRTDAVPKPFVCRFGVTATSVFSFSCVRDERSSGLSDGRGHTAYLNVDGRVSRMATCGI